jgi:hypothetical protein
MNEEDLRREDVYQVQAGKPGAWISASIRDRVAKELKEREDSGASVLPDDYKKAEKRISSRISKKLRKEGFETYGTRELTFKTKDKSEALKKAEIAKKILEEENVTTIYVKVDKQTSMK